VLLAKARSIDVASHKVELDPGTLHYDYLVVATGATHSYFGKEEQWAKLAPGLKSIEDALEIRALQGGRHVARIIAGGERGPFHYHDKGNLATIGRAEAVVATKRIARHGLVVWLLWWVVHIFFLIGFRNRVLVMFSWAWSWLTFKRGSRLITGNVGALPAVTTIGADGQIALPAASDSMVLITSEAISRASSSDGGSLRPGRS
jgi:NADH dehydrogenase FAD-containing subunit